MVDEFPWKSALVVMLFAATHVPGASADTVQGEVARIWIRADNVAHFRLKGDACKVQTSGANPYWKFSLDTVAGKAWYDMLLASAYAGKAVKVSTPACSATTSQSIRYVYQDYGTAASVQTPTSPDPVTTPTPPTVPITPSPDSSSSSATAPTPPTPSPPATPPTGIPTLPSGRPNAVFN